MSTFSFRLLYSYLNYNSLQIHWWLQVVILMLIIAVVAAIYLYIQKWKAKKELAVVKDMLRVQLEIQDLTFSAISKEVHDNVGQMLSLVKVQLNLISEGNEKKNHLLEEAKNNISTALEDLREIAKGLSNRKLVSMGLISSLEHETARLNELGHGHISLKIEGNPVPVTETQHLVIFRAVQYFLNGLTGQDSPSKVMVKLWFFENNWQVIIYSPRIQQSWQVESEKEFLDEHALVLRRLSIIGATFNVSTEGETQIIINVPYA
ncbi:MAG: sensor histidine kinase [Bacteroidota bacterium]